MGRLKALPITPLGLGGGPLGNMFAPMTDEAARVVVDAAWDAGIRHFDTAPLYGHGLSERRLGAALRDRPRRELVVSTKVGRLLQSGRGDERSIFVDVDHAHPVYDYSADATRRSLAESLERLGLDRVDVALVHDPDDHEAEALTGAFPELVRLRDEGVVGAIGAGMNQAEMLARFVERVDLDCVLMAGRYTLLEQGALHTTLYDRCVERGVDVVAGGVFNSGLLADPHAAGATYEYGPARSRVAERARRLDAICARHGVTLRAAALQFPAAHPAVALVLFGARTGAEVRENTELATVDIPAALWDELRVEGLLDADAPVPVG